MEGQFLVRQIYDDEITYNLISAAVNKLSTYASAIAMKYNAYGTLCLRQREIYERFRAADIPANEILELFGRMFFEFCQDSGYDKILQVLGATPRDFLQVSLEQILFITIFSQVNNGPIGTLGRTIYVDAKSGIDNLHL